MNILRIQDGLKKYLEGKTFFSVFPSCFEWVFSGTRNQNLLLLKSFIVFSKYIKVIIKVVTFYW
jgi:hypothetical protein